MKIVYCILQSLKILIMIIFLPLSLLVALAGLLVAAREAESYQQFRSNLKKLRFAGQKVF